MPKLIFEAQLTELRSGSHDNQALQLHVDDPREGSKEIVEYLTAPLLTDANQSGAPILTGD
jgi:hypothetical protein